MLLLLPVDVLVMSSQSVFFAANCMCFIQLAVFVYAVTQVEKVSPKEKERERKRRLFAR